MTYKIVSKFLETEDKPSYKVTDENGLIFLIKIVENNEYCKNLV